jgi:hypothetical protein
MSCRKTPDHEKWPADNSPSLTPQCLAMAPSGSSAIRNLARNGVLGDRAPDDNVTHQATRRWATEDVKPRNITLSLRWENYEE